MTALKQTCSKGEIYLYPFPPRKEDKWLLSVPTNKMGMIVQEFWKRFPFSPFDNWSIHDWHEDKVTPLFRWGRHKNLAFLPSRSKDVARAEQLELLWWKKIEAMATSSELVQWEERKNQLQRCIENQEACSSCQELGILSPNVQSWKDFLLNLEWEQS